MNVGFVCPQCTLPFNADVPEDVVRAIQQGARHPLCESCAIPKLGGVRFPFYVGQGCTLVGPNGQSMPAIVGGYVFGGDQGNLVSVTVLGKTIEPTAPPELDLRAVWDDFVLRMAAEQDVRGPSAEPLTVTVEVEELRRHLEARGLRGFDLVVSERGAVVIVPKILKVGFMIAKVPE